MIEIAGEKIDRGQKRRLDLPVARLPTQTLISLPVTVINGVEEGARLWLSAAIHGDEINGVEIIRQVVEQINPKKLRGTLIAVPIVNIFGFIAQSRYLPDRRDLNRAFPGSPNGSLAARLAHLFMKEIVSRCTHGIDLHTASDHRINLPQIRANLQDKATYYCAKAFGTSIIIHANLRDGSLREAASRKGIPILLYEGGEALRFDTEAIDAGVAGILQVMNYLRMIEVASLCCANNAIEVDSSKWIRASRGGILILQINLGERVQKKQLLGIISDAFGEKKTHVRSPIEGMVIGHTQCPLVNQGDAVIHLAVLPTSPLRISQL